MERCFQLAQLGLGKVKTNPMVGSVIVYQGKIIGEGYHKKYGFAHAEVNAINSVRPENKSLLSKSTIYVSLEPCFHFGKTPPCVNLLLKHKIPKVVISCIDPNPKVGGKSVEKLRQHGVEVITEILERKGRQVARRFFTRMEKKRPYIILKYAQSQDGYLGKPNEQVWITNALSKRLTHRWRSEEAAILVGTNTAAIDNPQLTNRLWTGASPLRVVLDKTLRLPKTLRLFDGQHPTLVFTEKPCSNQPNVQYHTIDFSMGIAEQLRQLLTILYKMKIGSIIVEGGTQLLESFIQQDMWDEARIFVGAKRLNGGLPAPNLLYQPFPQSKTIIDSDQLIVSIRNF